MTTASNPNNFTKPAVAQGSSEQNPQIALIQTSSGTSTEGIHSSNVPKRVEAGDVRVDVSSPRFAYSYEYKNTGCRIAIEEQYRANCEAALSDGYVIPDTPEFRFSDILGPREPQQRESYSRLKRQVESRAGRGERVYIADRLRLGRFSDPRRYFAEESNFASHGVPIKYSAHANSGSDDKIARVEASEDAKLYQAMLKVIEGVTRRGRARRAPLSFPKAGEAPSPL